MHDTPSKDRSWECPGVHSQSRRAELCRALVLLAGHGSGATEPDGQYEPGGHGAHCPSPAVLLNDPGRQATQDRESWSWVKPAEHTQSDKAVAPTESDSLNAGHRRQDSFPAWGLKDVMLHSSHAGPALERPARHTHCAMLEAWLPLSVVVVLGHGTQ